MEELQFLFDGFIQLWMFLGDPGAQVCVDATGITIAPAEGMHSNSIDIGATDPIIRPLGPEMGPEW